MQRDVIDKNYIPEIAPQPATRICDKKDGYSPTWLAAMTGLDADATAQAASTPHARRPAPLAHAGSVFPPASAAEHATRHLGRRGRQSAAPDGEARQDDAMPMRLRCGWLGLCEVKEGRERRGWR